MGEKIVIPMFNELYDNGEAPETTRSLLEESDLVHATEQHYESFNVLFWAYSKYRRRVHGYTMYRPSGRLLADKTAHSAGARDRHATNAIQEIREIEKMKGAMR